FSSCILAAVPADGGDRTPLPSGNRLARDADFPLDWLAVTARGWLSDRVAWPGDSVRAGRQRLPGGADLRRLGSRLARQFLQGHRDLVGRERPRLHQRRRGPGPADQTQLTWSRRLPARRRIPPRGLVLLPRAGLHQVAAGRADRRSGPAPVPPPAD